MHKKVLFKINRYISVILFLINLLFVVGCSPKQISNPVGRFVKGPFLHEVRVSHTATLLDNGNVLIAGGMVPSKIFFPKSAELYLSNENRFIEIRGLNEPRVDHAAVKLSNGKVLFLGGYGPLVLKGKKISTIEEYDPQTQRFNTVGKMLDARSPCQALLLNNNKVFIYGGAGVNSGGYWRCEIYNPETHISTYTSKMCFRGIQHGHDLVKLADGRVFIKEGTTLTPQKMENIIKVNRLYLIDQNPDSVHLGAIQIYDPEKDIFSVQFALHAFRESGSVFLLPDNKVLFFGGHGSGLRGWTKEIEIYNPRSGRSDVVGSISNMNQKYEPALIKNRYILIIGDKQQVFDIQTHNTMNVGPMFVLREGTMTRLQNGDVLIAGGLNFKAGEKSRMAEIFKLFH